MRGLTSMVAFLALVSIGFLATCFVQVEAQGYAYNMTVNLARDKMERKEGKLKMTIVGPGYTHKVALSPEKETLFPGATHRYLIGLPYTIDRIDGVKMEWSQKREIGSPSTWLRIGENKIYIDSVILDPIYEQNYAFRMSQMKTFCGSKRPRSVELGELEEFKNRC